MVKFKIVHTTDNEEEYEAIMGIIRHYEIVRKKIREVKKCTNQKEKR